MAARNLTDQEFALFKDDVVTELIAQSEEEMDILYRDSSLYKLICAHPFYHDSKAYVAVFEIHEDKLWKIVYRIYFDGCCLKHVRISSCTYSAELIPF